MKQELARQYANLEEWHWWFRGRTRILETVLRRELPDGGSRRLLSIGCGPATGLAWLLPFAGPDGSVVGLDIEPLHARNLPSGVKFTIGGLPAAPLSDASFDVVLALDVLEHLDDDLAGLWSAARLVAPGGLLIVTVPALPSLWGGHDILSEHRRRYTRKTLQLLFAASSLPPGRISYFNTVLLPMVAAVRWSRRALGLEGRARSDFDKTRPGVLNEALARIFGLESLFINWARLPVGVSLLATCRPAGFSSYRLRRNP
ncbi:MAG: class I SAM-dependent methyltransferase [Acidobacteriota bacterium]